MKTASSFENLGKKVKKKWRPGKKEEAVLLLLLLFVKAYQGTYIFYQSLSIFRTK